MKLGFQHANQLTHLASPEKLASFEYDKNGRMVSEMIKELSTVNPEGGSVAPAKTSVVQYSYGYLDKVLSVNRNGNETKFHYNADGMLIGKQQVSPDSAGGREELEPWIWDGLALAMKDGITFASENHISGGAAVLATPVDGEVQDTRMLLNDHLGTTLAIFGKDAPGNVHTTSFGKALGASSDTAMFTGKPYDADLGAHVFAFRNYRSDLARWTSADPAGYPDGPNQQFYAPVPTHGLDPLGLDSVAVPLSGSETVTVDASEVFGVTALDFILNPLSAINTSLNDLEFDVEVTADGSAAGVTPVTISNEAHGTKNGNTSTGIDVTIFNVGYRLTYEAVIKKRTLISSTPGTSGDGKETLTNVYQLDLELKWDYAFVFTDQGSIDLPSVQATIEHTE